MPIVKYHTAQVCLAQGIAVSLFSSKVAGCSAKIVRRINSNLSNGFTYVQRTVLHFFKLRAVFLSVSRALACAS